MGGDLSAGQRHPAQLQGEQAADRVDVEVLVEVDVVELPDILDRQPCGHPEHVVAQLFHRRHLIGVVLVGNLADDLLQHVLDGDQSGGCAVLINEQGDVDAVSLHFLEQVIERLGVRNEHRRAHDLGHGDVPGCAGRVIRAAHQILEIHHPQDVVDVLPDDRDAGVATADRQRSRLGRTLVALDPHHLRARDHHLPRRGVAEFEHGLDHSAFVGGHHATLLGQIHHLAQFDLGGERAVTETPSGCQRIAEQDKQPADRGEQHRDRLQRKR